MHLGDAALINHIKTMKDSSLPGFKVLVKSIEKSDRKLKWAKYFPDIHEEILKEYDFCGESIN